MSERKIRLFYILISILCCGELANAQITLLGDNAPHANVNDGNFESVWADWRQAKQSPFWTTDPIQGDKPMGLFYGKMFSSNELGVAESKQLNTNPDYQNPKAGDVLNWSFGADLEYISKGTISISLVFGEHERILAGKVKLIGSDKIAEHFKGTYTLTEEDAQAGLPYVRATFYSEQDVKVYLHYVNISVIAPTKAGPELTAKVLQEGIQLSWKDEKADMSSRFIVYRSHGSKFGYEKLGETKQSSFMDKQLICGIDYTYVVTRVDEFESGASNKVFIVKKDKEAPAPPSQIRTEIFETEIGLSWTESVDNDVLSYSIYRGDAEGNNMREIAHKISNKSYVDFTPIKNHENTYVIYAHDYSGNKSMPSTPVIAKVKAVMGASFSDLILPMPIHKELSSDLWGAESVLPRDPDNGIEHPDWSYWGGRPVKDKDGKYHMVVTRWPANATKGHWEWPNSTATHVVADKPTGPYMVKDELAYSFHNGLGHNPDIILLNDGTFMLYALIDWVATLFTSESMNGPWKRLGAITVNWRDSNEDESLSYRFFRNLSGVQLNDGRFLFVTKGGAMMISDSGPLGPYQVLTKPIQHNEIIPEKYRNSNYEDPVIWKDEVQFHMMINAFWDYRAIYLRSPDGIHWKFNPGTAYTPDNTSYEDGTRTHWYKLERPHVIQDEYGRATHLSLAVIDVLKADDLARDKHNSKNIIIPLTIHKRIKILNKEKVTSSTKNIKIIIQSEENFDAQKDIDVESLRFGASEEVDFGRACKAISSKKKGTDLIVKFNGTGNGITEDNFACKLLGNTKKGDLLIGFTKLSAD